MHDNADRATVAEHAARAGARVAHEHFRTGIAVETKDGPTDVVTEADRAAQREVVDVVRARYAEDAIVGEEEDERKRVPDAGPAWVVDPIDGTSNYVRGLRTWATAVAAVEDGEPVAAAIVMPASQDTYLASSDGTAEGEDGGTDSDDRFGAGVSRNDEPISVSDVDDPALATVVPTIWWETDRRDEYTRACEAIVTRFADLRRFGCTQAELAMVADGGVDGVFTNVRAHPWDTLAGVHLIREAGGRVTDLDGNRWRHDSRGLVASNGAIHDAVLEAARDVDPEK